MKAPRPVYGLYLGIFLLTGVFAGCTYRLAEFSIANLGCRYSSDPDAFLAYCQSPRFGFYEQGAYYFGFEKAAIRNAEKAQVLFFGNSHSQHAFSTDAVRSYFARLAIPYHLLGFSYAERDGFAEMLVERVHLAPKVVVIVADPFFAHGYLSKVAQELKSSDHSSTERVSLWLDHLVKKIFGRLQPYLCANPLATSCDKFQALYRRRSDGSWIWENVFSPPEKSVAFRAPSELPVLSPDRAPEILDAAAAFFRRLGVTPECVVLTDVPTNEQNAQPFARRLAALSGANVILPDVADLAGIDPSHLNKASAQRWSAAFVEALAPIVERCVGRRLSQGR